VVPDGAVGEIWVNSPSVASGYWHKPEDTARTFGAVTADSGEGPYLRTGDLGSIVDGRLFVTGRIKDVLIVRGVKHYPQDLEATAEHAHSAVRPGCCAAFAVDRDGEECIALVAETDTARAEFEGELQKAIASIRRYVAERHQVSLCAVAIVPAGSLPKTTSGKLQRFLCRDAFRAGEFQLLASWSEAVGQPLRADSAVGQPFRADPAVGQPFRADPAVGQPFRAAVTTS
jgi:acyl-CoA synthetase (AMP-forming)/AMP-acid ligase II